MLDPGAYTEAVRIAVAGTAEVAEGNLDAPVEHCPEFDVRGLLLHTGGFSRFVGRIIGGREWEGSGAWRTPSEEDVGGDPVGWHTRCGAGLVAAMETGDPAAPSATWAGDRTRLFWYRRAAQELSVHHWDAAHARGGSRGIAPEIAADGVDEFLGEFGPRVAACYKGDGEQYRFVATDVGAEFTITMRPGRIDRSVVSGPGGVTARATSDVLLLFLWGRMPASALDAHGDVDLLDTWLERVRV